MRDHLTDCTSLLPGVPFKNYGDSKEVSQLLTAGLNYPLDAFGQFSLSAEYRNGDVPLVQDKTDELTVGLRIKF